jgi:hypothetical protein
MLESAILNRGAMQLGLLISLMHGSSKSVVVVKDFKELLLIVCVVDA